MRCGKWRGLQRTRGNLYSTMRLWTVHGHSRMLCICWSWTQPLVSINSTDLSVTITQWSLYGCVEHRRPLISWACCEQGTQPHCDSRAVELLLGCLKTSGQNKDHYRMSLMSDLFIREIFVFLSIFVTRSWADELKPKRMRLWPRQPESD